MSAAPDHASRVAAEIAFFRDLDIYALPKIFHYWSQKWLGPHVKEVFGSSDLYGLLAAEVAASLQATGLPGIVSVGAGEGGVEMAIADRLLQSGVRDFRIECVELSPHLIEKGRAAAAERGLAERVVFTEADLTNWAPAETYGAAFAHHSLHHIVALEHVFDRIKDRLHDNGAFVVADMIGRNGHMRWPEVLAIIERLWTTIPERYKYHHLFSQQMETYLNWDCSGSCFEGIRAQDIMLELVKRFHFRKLCVWGAVSDIFLDRAFGHNLDPANPADMAFIDNLWQAECALLRAGGLTPTVMLAVMTKRPGPLVSTFGLSPESCIRLADPPPPESPPEPQTQPVVAAAAEQSPASVAQPDVPNFRRRLKQLFWPGT